ncbi:YciI family protein [Nonomuraea sp. SBT364]|uniref:YciI family protein n=1 Tax=Nonomuraea sp. SBT364 TaxID=1580530 RepID=UPI00066C987D|nr:YciI family protein [Nonomuraea sp. SBT364]
MKFQLSVYADAQGHEAFVTTARQAGELISGHALADPSISAVVRVLDGVVTVTDGPYARDREHVTGQYVVDCESRERALELAALLPGGVEVRPLMDPAGMEM